MFACNVCDCTCMFMTRYCALWRSVYRNYINVGKLHITLKLLRCAAAPRKQFLHRNISLRVSRRPDFCFLVITGQISYVFLYLWGGKKALLTLIRPGGGGGGVESTPPSTFRAIISWKFFSAHRAFATFFFRVLRNFWCYFRKNRPYCSEVTQRYVIERRLKIWEFSGFVYKTYGKWLFVLNIHFGL